MPKMTVMTLPEQVFTETRPQTAVSANKTPRRRLTWSRLGMKLYQAIQTLFDWNALPLYILTVMISRLTILGEVSPFGLALFAAVVQIDRPKALCMAIWAVVGVMSSGYFYEAGIYAMAAILYFRWQHTITRMHKKMQAVPLLMFCSMLSGGWLLVFMRGGSLYDAATAVVNAAICLLACWLFMYGVPLLTMKAERVGVARMTRDEHIACLLFMLALGIAGLSETAVWGYSLRSMVGSLLVLAFAASGGAGMGAVAGITVGFVAGLHDGNVPLAVSLYAAAGLCGGACRSWGKCAVVLAFIAGAAAVHLCLTELDRLLQLLTEHTIAAVLFLFIPASRLLLFQRTVDHSARRTGNIAVDQAIAKMNGVAGMFGELADAFGAMTADSQARIRDEELARLLTAVGEQVCETCQQRTKCWEEDFYRTYQAMLDMLGQAAHSKLHVNNMAAALREHCIRQQPLIEVVNSVTERNKTNSYWQKRIADHRQMVTEQMRATSSIINNLIQEMIKQPQADDELAAAFKHKAALIDCQLDTVCITGSYGGRMMEVVKAPCNGTRECVNSILPLAAGVMREKMLMQSECGNLGAKKKCKLVMQVAKRFSVETGIACAAKEMQAVCGDTCAVVPLHKGKIALLLSDGMGSGSTAAGQSSMAVQFLERLLAVGFEVDAAVQTVNSMLLLKTPEETFATIDMTIIDTYSGQAEFLKIGAAPSFVKRVCEVSAIQSASLPMGIINQMELKPIKKTLVSGDLLVMVSDGIADAYKRSDGKENWLVNFLRMSSCTDAQQLADDILQQAVVLSGNSVCDDMSVIVSHIDECRHESQLD